MRRLVINVAALGFLACVPATAENNNHRGDYHNATTSDADRGSADIRKDDRRPAIMRQNANGNTSAKLRGIVTREKDPAVDTSPIQYLPASGDVYPNSVSDSTADRTQNSSGWIGNTATRYSERNALRRNMQAPRRVHGGPYIAPQDYQYRHWSYGERLPRVYYARDYWIGDFVGLGLSVPPSDLVWVRVGDDTLLINRNTGEIVQARYNFFY